jgi:dTDP-4-dehydrorhamnose 3,5-epimerase
MRLTRSPTSIDGVIVVETVPFVDHRGSLTRLFCSRQLASLIGERQIVQINHSRTAAAGAIRGLHFQNPPHAEMKLIRCLRGRVWDVAVDLRTGSPTFLQWHAEELTASNSRMLVISEGCAHGFQTLEPDCELLYLHTAWYAPEAEGGIRFNDPRLGIAWPLPPGDLSQRDQGHALLPDNFAGIAI